MTNAKAFLSAQKRTCLGVAEGTGKPIYGPWEDRGRFSPNILVNAGRDFLHNNGYVFSALITQTAQWCAVTTDSGAPGATDTTLTGEANTNGLSRAAATTQTHSASTNTTTMGITYTATGSFTAVQKGSLHANGSTTPMVHEATFSSTNLANLDQLQLTWTITLG